jgi:hypothetical protein
VRATGQTEQEIRLDGGGLCVNESVRATYDGDTVIPKSTKPSRIAENIDEFEFELSTEELAANDALDTGRRGGPEPGAITLKPFGARDPGGLRTTCLVPIVAAQERCSSTHNSGSSR